VSEKPLLSVIITSYTVERQKDIFALLDNLKSQTYPNIEVIMVVENSIELLESIKQRVSGQTTPPIRIIYNSGEQGLSAARNLGFSESNGNIVAFIDDDAFPCPEWAEQITKTFEDDSVIGVTGPSIPLWENENLAWVPEEFYWIIGASGYKEWTENREVRNVSGTNMSFKREAFTLAGLFSTGLGAIEGGGGLGKQKFSGEETEFCIRLKTKSNKRIIYDPEVQVCHRVYKYRITPRFIARRAYSEGYTKAMFKKRYPNQNGKNTLNVEFNLLNRICTRLLPSTFRGLFIHPGVSFRRLGMTVNALFFTASGYFFYQIKYMFT
jgi:glucosyl-dolichyl phosphate glucuronosyltransferase